VSTADFELQGQLAPPLSNGELVFEAPWQGRVFGMARSLCVAGLFTWDEFRERLIQAIEQWEFVHTGDSENYAYYDLFLLAFENLLADKKLLAGELLSREVATLNARPHNHDHKH